MMNRVNAIPWRLRLARYRLQGARCERCGQPVYPPRPVCCHCAEARQSQATVLHLPWVWRVNLEKVER